MLDWNHSIGKQCNKTALLGGWVNRAFEEHTFNVKDVAFSPDGHFCLAIYEHMLRLWNVSTGQSMRTFELRASDELYRSDGGDCVAFSLDGRFCVSGSDSEIRRRRNSNNALKLWELDWEYEFPGWADWDEAARPYLEIFLTRLCSRGEDGISPAGCPRWNDKHFK